MSGGLIGRILRKLRYYFRYFISIPVALVFMVLSPFIKIRLVKLFSDRIGHYAENTELMLCTLDMNPAFKKNKYFFYTCAAYVPICNTQLHLMWKRVIPIVPYPHIAYQVDHLLSLLSGKYKRDFVKSTFEATSGGRDFDGLLEKIKKPHLTFTEYEEQMGKESMMQFEIPADAQFICLMVRDSAYLKQHLPGLDWSYHNFRDADIMNYKKAALFLAEKGYYVIRMGKCVEKKFEISHPRIIDYANHPLRSDFMDIYLSARCFFSVSTSTGLDSIPRIFRRPGVYTNLVLPGELPTWYPSVLFIPKKVRDTVTQKTLTFKKIYQIFIAQPHLKTMEILKREGLEVIENTEEEILEVVQEMEARLTNLWQDENEDTMLQQKFWKDFPRTLKDASGVSVHAKNIKIKIGRDFLSQNTRLLS